MAQDDLGDPMLTSRVSATELNVYFYGCTNNADCTPIQISAGYDTDDGVSMDLINAWNAGHRFGRAYLDKEDDPYVEMDMNLDHGGVSEGNFRDTLDWWRVVVEAFEDHIEW